MLRITPAGSITYRLSNRKSAPKTCSSNGTQVMSRNNHVVKIALYRPHDDKYSATKFPFTYFPHDTDDCHFCSIMGPSTLRVTNHARRNIRRRINLYWEYFNKRR